MKRLLVLASCVVATVGATLPPDPRAQDALGDLHVLVIRATWGPAPTGGGDLSDAAAFYSRASFGKLRLHLDLTPWLHAYTKPLCVGDPTARSVYGAVGELAQEAAARAGYDLASYGRIAYFLPEATCNFRGLGVGREVFIATDGGVLDDLVFVHELGHTLGLPHATSYTCPRGCRHINEYGDPLSPMGSGGTDFSALEKLKLGWISSVQRVSSSRTYEVADIDAASAKPQVLVVPTNEGEYWIEHRANERRVIVRLVVPDNPTHPVYLRSLYIAQGDDRFVAANVFSVTRAFAFKWLDRKRPTMPRVRALDHAYLSWRPSWDGGSGVAEYRITVDGRRIATTSDLGTALPSLRDGGHRVAVVAVDRAGNRSRPGVVSLNV